MTGGPPFTSSGPKHALAEFFKRPQAVIKSALSKLCTHVVACQVESKNGVAGRVCAVQVATRLAYEHRRVQLNAVIQSDDISVRQSDTTFRHWLSE